MCKKTTSVLSVIVLVLVSGLTMSQTLGTISDNYQSRTNVRLKNSKTIGHDIMNPVGSSTTSVVNAEILSSVRVLTSFYGIIWIICRSDIDLLQGLDAEITDTFFNNQFTYIRGDIPNGWRSSVQKHYTSFAAFENSTINHSINPSIAPVILYDNERWDKTPIEERQNPGKYMAQFTELAHTNGFITEMAPDQNLASPLNGITTYLGGETRNWQSYLRLGLARQAAQAGTDRFHVMAQPFESNWGPTPEDTYVGGEAEYVNFVTQASLQARAINPKLVITCGLSANTRYNPTAAIMYQESIDVQHLVDGFWLNIWGNEMGLAYLRLLTGTAPKPNSSVLFLQPKDSLDNFLPDEGSASKFSLAKMGDTLVSETSQTFQAGTVIPPGPWEFQFWTDSTSGTAELGLEFGYSSPEGKQTPIIRSATGWMPTVTANALGAVDSDGAFSTKISTTLPPGGPYRLYWKLTVLKTSGFNLLYGSTSAPTNLATPFIYHIVHPIVQRVLLPSVPACVSPTSQLIDVPRQTTFKWRPSVYTEKYEIQIATDTNMYSSGDSATASLIQNIVFDTTLRDTTFQLSTALRSLTKYYWHVRALNPSAASRYSDPLEFTTGNVIALPLIPTPISPRAYVTGVPRKPVFKWNTSLYAESYELQIASDYYIYTEDDSLGAFLAENVVFDTTISDTIIQLSVPLDSLKEYYWHVRAINSAGKSAYYNNPLFFFTTGTELTTDIKKENNIPGKFELYNNYPNPFNPTTSIKYTLKKSGFVSLKVYNILGKQVSALVNGFQKAGWYKVNFDASKLATGVYMYRLETKGFSQTKKMLLMK